MSSLTDTTVDTTPQTSHGEPGDHDRYGHLVDSDEYLESMMTGKAITALCGKTWVPTRDGRKFPMCPACKQVRDGLEGESSIL